MYNVVMKVVWIVVGGILVGGVIVGGFIMMQKKPANQPVELAPIPTESPVSETEPEMVKYQNEAGFSFEHPSDVEVKENELDSKSYANLSIESKVHEGIILINVTELTDKKIKDVTDWLKTAPLSKSEKITEVKLGDINALKIETDMDISIVAIEQPISYNINADPNDEYWANIVDTVVASWKFELPETPTTAPAKNSGGGAPASGGDIYEEETIE